MEWDGHWPRYDVYAVPIVCVLLAYGVFDVLVARHTKARWFTVHVLANTIVVCCTLPRMAALLHDPVPTLLSENFSAVGMSANLMIHLYHVAFFDDLIWIDWLHHGLMTGIVTPLAMSYDTSFGVVLDGALFFMCGLPGGLDYVMLVLVKHKAMHPLTEKKYNAFLNTWVRSTGLMFVCSVGFVQAHLKEPATSYLQLTTMLKLAVLFLLIWNSQFFAERVVGNYHVRRYQAEQKAKESASAPSGNGIESVSHGSRTAAHTTE